MTCRPRESEHAFVVTRRLATVVLAVAVVGAGLGVASNVSAQAKYAPAFPRDGAIKLQDTDLMTFWEVLHEKGFKAPPHELLLDQVTITLTEGAIKFAKPDGSARIEQVKLGSVRVESKGTVLQEEGMSDVPSREIVVQLKDVPSPHWPVTPGMPGQFPRLDAVKLLENARIRVWDQIWLPNRPVTNHLHYTPTVAIFLSAGFFNSHAPGQPKGKGSERYIGFIRADDHPAPIAAPHEEEWVSGAPRAIWIEMK